MFYSDYVCSIAPAQGNKAAAFFSTPKPEVMVFPVQLQKMLDNRIRQFTAAL